MTETTPIGFETDESDVFLMRGGRPVAKWGKRGTPGAEKWISLAPGVVVSGTIANSTVYIDGVRVARWDNEPACVIALRSPSIRSSSTSANSSSS